MRSARTPPQPLSLIDRLIACLIDCFDESEVSGMLAAPAGGVFGGPLVGVFSLFPDPAAGSGRTRRRRWQTQTQPSPPRSAGVFVYVLIVKLVHFIYIEISVFVLLVFFFFFYNTSDLVESSEYVENALYFSISQRNYFTHRDFSCT